MPLGHARSVQVGELLLDVPAGEVRSQQRPEDPHVAGLGQRDLVVLLRLGMVVVHTAHEQRRIPRLLHRDMHRLVAGGDVEGVDDDQRTGHLVCDVVVGCSREARAHDDERQFTGFLGDSRVRHEISLSRDSTAISSEVLAST